MKAMTTIENWPQFIVRNACGINWALCNGENRLPYVVTGSVSLAGSEKGSTALVGNCVFVCGCVTIFIGRESRCRCMCVMGVGELH